MNGCHLQILGFDSRSAVLWVPIEMGISFSNFHIQQAMR